MRNPRAIGATVATLALIAVPLVAQAGTNTPTGATAAVAAATAPGPVAVKKFCKDNKTKAITSRGTCKPGEIAVTLASVQGAQGAPGKSAYDLAIAGGFTGTQAEWLTSLKGKDGAPGAPGKDGAVGPAGEPGAKGEKGEPGDSAGIVRKCASVTVNADFADLPARDRKITVTGLPAYSSIMSYTTDGTGVNVTIPGVDVTSQDLVAANTASLADAIDANIVLRAMGTGQDFSGPLSDGTTTRSFRVQNISGVTGAESGELRVCVARLSLA